MSEEKQSLKVFLCHAHDDKIKARDLYSALKLCGTHPWLDAEDLLPGQAWQIEIPKALEDSEVIIILLSKSSVNKEGYVQKEIKFSLDKALEKREDSIFLIPARLEDCEVPYSLSSKYHWVNLFEEDGPEKLLRSLNRRAQQLGRVSVKTSWPIESKTEYLTITIAIGNKPLQTIKGDISTIRDLESIFETVRGGVEALEIPRASNMDQKALNEIFKELNLLSGLSEITRRIELYRQALAIVSRETQPELWSALQDGLASSLAQTPTGSRSENLERAIQHFKLALAVRNRQRCPQEWASTLNNLATAYRERIYGKQAENIELAIGYYQQALEVRTQEAFPIAWAMTQNHLGSAYRNRIRGDRFENTEQAIYHFEQALNVRTRQAFPEDWAMTQNNLGAAYLVRTRGNRTENIERAIHHFEQALEVSTRQTFLENWADTQNNLGNAYLARRSGERIENIERAIRHFEQAQEVSTRQAFPESWASIHNNLGNAYLISIYGKQTESIQRAVPSEEAGNAQQDKYRVETLTKVKTRLAFSKDWAQVLNGLNYTERTYAAENAERAIDYFQQALNVYTRLAFPKDWAQVHNNLGNAFLIRLKGERAENIENAVQHYQQALNVYSHEAFPEDCLKTGRALGTLAFELRRWQLAKDTYDVVFGAHSILMQTSLTRAGKQVEMDEVRNLSSNAAYACIQLGDVERAVEVLEQARTQLLREALERRQLEQLPALGFKHFYEDYMQAAQQHDSEYPVFQTRQAEEKLQATIAAIREEVGWSHPQYRYFLQALPFTEIQKQAQERPLVYLCATSAGGSALVVTRQGVQVIKLPKLNHASLQRRIWHPTEEETDRINEHIKLGKIELEDIRSVRGGYFSMYALWSLSIYFTNASRDLIGKLFSTWQDTLDETTRWLWDVAMGELISVLKEQSSSATLIPTGQLAILPLHAAWREDLSKPTGRLYALDELNINYVPSAHALWQASLGMERPSERLVAVSNPDGSLVYSKDEIKAVMNGFDKSNSRDLHGKGATIKAVKEEIQKAHVLHFSTHGNAGWEMAEQARLKLADGYLTVPDIFALDLDHARLAVLSTSETALPGLELIDEMIGLPAAMMQAGVPGVIGSLWSINDGSTALLMARFYKFWRQEGKTPQEALRLAQIWLRDNLYESPYYWAAFTYTGV